MAATSPITVDTVRAQVAEILAEPETDIGDHDNLLDRGIDSIRLMSLVEKFRRDGVEVSFVDLAENPTVAAWTEVISGATERTEG
ncbi:phosphopantetheine-binding protein [Pseudonocardia acaciae]|uniref:phosphopantetheine-binding protein n=1 Tax=Pseudonocardia acaciae TaxID=551276 RepID=UPI00056555EE|nr:phosphopantetheine-binding protein [Pseudonocardia acaciae]